MRFALSRSERVIELARDFFAWVEALPPILAYLTLLAVAYGENLIPPMPGDLLIVFAGYLVSTGSMQLAAVVIIATVGGGLGFMTMFWFGRTIEGALMNPERFRWIPKKRLARALEWVNRRGYQVVLANRFLSGLRSVIALASGMAALAWWRTLLYSTLSAALWSGLLVGFGYWLGANWELVSVGLKRYSAVVTVLIILFVVIQLWRYRRDRASGVD